MKALFLVTFLVALGAQAQGVNVLICRGENPHALNREQAIYAVSAGMKQINQELGQRLRIASIRVRACNVSSRLEDLYGGSTFHSVYRLFRPRDISDGEYNLAILPGITYQAKTGLGGASTGVCELLSDWNLAIVAAPYINSSGDDRFTEAPYAVAHELAHLLGCFHDNSEPVNIMNENPLPYIKPFGGVHFTRACKQQIKACKYDVRRGR